MGSSYLCPADWQRLLPIVEFVRRDDPRIWLEFENLAKLCDKYASKLSIGAPWTVRLKHRARNRRQVEGDDRIECTRTRGNVRLCKATPLLDAATFSTRIVMPPLSWARRMTTDSYRQLATVREVVANGHALHVFGDVDFEASEFAAVIDVLDDGTGAPIPGQQLSS
jgi:hypothetical protein